MQAFRRAEVTTMIPLLMMKLNVGSVVAAESVIGVTGSVIKTAGVLNFLTMASVGIAKGQDVY